MWVSKKHLVRYDWGSLDFPLSLFWFSWSVSTLRIEVCMRTAFCLPSGPQFWAPVLQYSPSKHSSVCVCVLKQSNLKTPYCPACKSHTVHFRAFQHTNTLSFQLASSLTHTHTGKPHLLTVCVFVCEVLTAFWPFCLIYLALGVERRKRRRGRKQPPSLTTWTSWRRGRVDRLIWCKFF